MGKKMKTINIIPTDYEGNPRGEYTMIITLDQIINETYDGLDNDQIKKAINAAYWAGQSEMRGRITEQIERRLESLPETRYHNIARKAAEHMVVNVDGINGNYVFLKRGDSGRGEYKDFLEWDFDLPCTP